MSRQHQTASSVVWQLSRAITSLLNSTQLNSTQPEIMDAGVNISMPESICPRF